VFFFGHSLLLAWGYQAVSRLFSVKLTFFQCLVAWLSSLPLKYLPGKIGIMVGRLFIQSKWGVPASNTIATYLYEGGMCLFSGLLTGLLWVVIWSSRLRLIGLLGGAVVLVVALVVLHPWVLHRLLCGRIERWGGNADLPQLPASRNALLFLFYCGIWTYLGIPFYFLALALFPQEPLGLLVGSSAYSLSMLGGALTLVPGGLGVQELAGLVLLEEVYRSPEAPLIVALALRVFILVYEVLLGLPGLLVLVWRGGTEKITCPGRRTSQDG
jgi:glycosyltransferase 2 family protein